MVSILSAARTHTLHALESTSGLSYSKALELFPMTTGLDHDSFKSLDLFVEAVYSRHKDLLGVTLDLEALSNDWSKKPKLQIDSKYTPSWPETLLDFVVLPTFVQRRILDFLAESEGEIQLPLLLDSKLDLSNRRKMQLLGDVKGQFREFLMNPMTSIFLNGGIVDLLHLRKLGPSTIDVFEITLSEQAMSLSPNDVQKARVFQEAIWGIIKRFEKVASDEGQSTVVSAFRRTTLQDGRRAINDIFRREKSREKATEPGSMFFNEDSRLTLVELQAKWGPDLVCRLLPRRHDSCPRHSGN